MPADPASIELAKLLRIAIGDGECDQELDGLVNAVYARQNVIRQIASAEVLKVLRIGDVVRCEREGRRSKWDGATGVVREIKAGGKVAIKLDSGWGANILTSPAYMLTILEPAKRHG